LVERRERREAAGLQALQKAVDRGWADVATGRYTDLDEDRLEDFISKLGRQAVDRIESAG
jgi:antitoxin ParD1/3/4